MPPAVPEPESSPSLSESETPERSALPSADPLPPDPPEPFELLPDPPPLDPPLLDPPPPEPPPPDPPPEPPPPASATVAVQSVQKTP
jgi:periplasmic protein TonB